MNIQLLIKRLLRRRLRKRIMWLYESPAPSAEEGFRWIYDAPLWQWRKRWRALKRCGVGNSRSIEKAKKYLVFLNQ